MQRINRWDPQGNAIFAHWNLGKGASKNQGTSYFVWLSLDPQIHDVFHEWSTEWTLRGMDIAMWGNAVSWTDMTDLMDTFWVENACYSVPV